MRTVQSIFRDALNRVYPDERCTELMELLRIGASVSHDWACHLSPVAKL